jgi:hypothetical protein
MVSNPVKLVYPEQSRQERPMIQHLNTILLQFRKSFNRSSTWKNFVIIVMGFILRTNNYGITSMVSSLMLRADEYYNLLHFFRSSAYTVTQLYEKWIEIAQQETDFKRIAGRVILLGDHIKISKEGCHMPGIQILHQDSGNSGKGKSIEGHMFAQVSAVISSGGVSRSLPLMTERQQSPAKKEGSKKPTGDTLVTQMVNLVVNAIASLTDNAKAVVALDAYFSKAAAFIAANKAVDKDGYRRLEIVTRSRDDSVGYESPEPQPKGKKGRPPKYGKKIVLKQLFSDMTIFTETTLLLYGKQAKVRYRCLDLIWKPLQQKIRFIVVDTEGRGKMILMCSDLSLLPEDIITIYCLRFKIETSFDEQKNDVGSFAYHFWTSALPKRKRWKKTEQTPNLEGNANIASARRATDSFVCLGTIASGVLTIMAFSHNREIWNRYPGWIRTLRSHIPSLAITKETLTHGFHLDSKSLTGLNVCSIVNAKRRSGPFLFNDVA